MRTYPRVLVTTVPSAQFVCLFVRFQTLPCLMTHFLWPQLWCHLIKETITEPRKRTSPLLSCPYLLPQLSFFFLKAHLNSWHSVYVFEYLNIDFFLLEYNVSSMNWHVVWFRVLLSMSRTVTDSEEVLKSMLNEWMNKAVTEPRYGGWGEIFQ